MVDLPELVIDKGDGKYRVRIDIDLTIKDGKVESAGITHSIKKDMSRLNVMPEAFAEIVSECRPSLADSSIRKFYYELYKAGFEGITQRELMRACGPQMNLDTISYIFQRLEEFGWIKRIEQRTNLRGRPRIVVLLRDYAD